MLICLPHDELKIGYLFSRSISALLHLNTKNRALLGLNLLRPCTRPLSLRKLVQIPADRSLPQDSQIMTASLWLIECTWP